MPARVSLEYTHIYRVITDRGERLARVAGRLRHRAAARADFPAVGDWVALEIPTHGEEGRIRAVLPRTSRFSRRAAGDPTEEQVVAANVDVVFLVAGLDRDFNPRRLDRYLAVASESGAKPVVVLNKTDLVEDAERFATGVAALAPGVDVHAVSCHHPETLDPLHRYLGRGRTGALLGSSGVGKSTIVNRLVGFDLLRTRDVRITDSRGRHTSTSRQMVRLPAGGILIDTPGMRELQLWDAGEALAGGFPEIEAAAGNCRFRDCRHREEPGCAVREQVASGEIAATRLESYLKLGEELRLQEARKDQRAQIEEKRRARIGSKALAKRLREKDRY